MYLKCIGLTMQIVEENKAKPQEPAALESTKKENQVVKHNFLHTGVRLRSNQLNSGQGTVYFIKSD